MTLIQHLKEACARQPAASVALAAGWRDMISRYTGA